MTQPQTNGSITSHVTGSSAPLRVGSRNPFRTRRASQDEDVVAPVASISTSIVESEPGVIGERSPVPRIAAPSAQDGPRTSAPTTALDNIPPPLPPRNRGTLNSAASSASSATSARASSATPILSPSSPPSSSISPPESLSRIFTPPSGPPPPIYVPTPRRTLSPPRASSPLRRSQTPPPTPSRRSTLRISSPSPPRASRGRRLRSNSSETMRVLAEDLPPAYTPGPDTRHGERTVDIGPIRPFIRDDTIALEESLRRRRQIGNMSGIPGATRQQNWGYGSSGRPGPGSMGLSRLLVELLTGGGVRNSPGQSQYRPSLLDSPRGSMSAPLQPQLTGAPVPPQRTGGSYFPRQPTGMSSVGTSRGTWDQYPGQRSAPRSMLNGLPLPGRLSSHQSRRSSPSTHAALSESRHPMALLTDPRPTSIATSGRPLLYEGRVLVYPLGYECLKCTSIYFTCFHEPITMKFASPTGHNRGYRPLRDALFHGTPSALAPGDPMRPCRKCWSRYSRRYEGSLVNADWEGNVNGTGGTNYQRPISDPPPIPEHAVLAPSPSPAPSMTSSASGSLRGNQMMTNGPAVFLPFTQHTRRTSRSTGIIQPGDPRIGGRVCWKCNGTGEVIVFIFDRARCRVCGGLGRVM